MDLFELTNMSRFHVVKQDRYYHNKPATDKKMTTNSGESGFCKNSQCEHANNEHRYRVCKRTDAMCVGSAVKSLERVTVCTTES